MELPSSVADILGNDLCAALATRTPAGGVALTPVTTLGAFDPMAGTVSTSTCLGNFAKLRNIDRDPRVAVVFHARDHTALDSTDVVVVQGRASFPVDPDPVFADTDLLPRWDEFMPPRKHGRFWGWVGREYYEARVPITVAAERVIVLDGPTGERTLSVGVADGGEPTSQSAPKNGTGARVAPGKYSKRLAKCRHSLLGWVDSDGYPVAVPVEAELDGDVLRLGGAGLPDGARRAGFLAHWFEPRLVGQGSVLMTGWLERDGDSAVYAPHTLKGYEVPASEAMFALGGGLAAKFGYRKAVQLGHVVDGTWQR